MSGHFQSTDLPSQLLLLTTLRLITLAPNQNFTHARSGPVRALSEVLQRYLALLAGNARDVAHLSGREQASLEDVVGALENMGYSQTQMLRWAQDAANASPPDDEQKDLASLANLLGPSFLNLQRNYSAKMPVAQIHKEARNQRNGNDCHSARLRNSSRTP